MLPSGNIDSDWVYGGLEDVNAWDAHTVRHHLADALWGVTGHYYDPLNFSLFARKFSELFGFRPSRIIGWLKGDAKPSEDDWLKIAATIQDRLVLLSGTASRYAKIHSAVIFNRGKIKAQRSARRGSRWGR